LTDALSVSGALKAATDRLAAVGIATARLDAEILLSNTLGCRRMDLLVRRSDEMDKRDLGAFEALIVRRERLEPVAYILREQEFWSLPFRVTPDTLIPRPDTETLVEVVLTAAASQRAPQILDLGTGSGCILLSLLHEMKDAVGIGVDVSDKALDVATENARALGLEGRVTFRHGSWFDPLEAESRFDVIVSNPPYIPTADIAGLMADVREHEPMSALDGGEDGLAPYRLITRQGHAKLMPGGLLAVEVGTGQADDVARLFESAGFFDICVTPDLSGIPRVVSGKK
jgi:release factor glutamine methyltransferase